MGIRKPLRWILHPQGSLVRSNPACLLAAAVAPAARVSIASAWPHDPSIDAPACTAADDPCRSRSLPERSGGLTRRFADPAENSCRAPYARVAGDPESVGRDAACQPAMPADITCTLR